MCGGEGTRLRPLTFERPKPCIPIVNVPSIIHLVDHLANLGFTDIIITLGYKGDTIEQTLGDGSLFGANITYVHEETKLGTAGSVFNAREYLADSPFLQRAAVQILVKPVTFRQLRNLARLLKLSSRRFQHG